MKLFVFDLDFTLWNAGDTWCDTTQPPYHWENGQLLDQSGRWLRLYDDVLAILEHLKENGKMVAAASRTYEPSWASDLLKLFDIEAYFDLQEIYPSEKTKHLSRILKDTNAKPNDVVFFDDEYRNIRDVSDMGIESVFVEDGLKWKLMAPYLK
ncbi:MAG TPA: magnesium-dependent phosphatase-1 [Sunxiuqinia sp.]|nr:magnesium-dependent phosphatase-1 [Sunxiuqinia sp.]